MKDCLISNTLVLTSYGKKTLGTLKEGDKIATRQGYRKVTRFCITGNKKVSRYHIIFEDKVGIDIIGTDSHRVFTDLGWVPLRYISEGMYLSRKDAEDLLKVSFVIREEIGIDLCYDIEVADEHEYYANEILVKSI